MEKKNKGNNNKVIPYGRRKLKYNYRNSVNDKIYMNWWEDIMTADKKGERQRIHKIIKDFQKKINFKKNIDLKIQEILNDNLYNLF